jgi:hypothetical protein
VLYEDESFERKKGKTLVIYIHTCYLSIDKYKGKKITSDSMTKIC